MRRLCVYRSAAAARLVAVPSLAARCAASASGTPAHDPEEYGEDPVTGYVPDKVAMERQARVEFAHLAPADKLRRTMVGTKHFNPDAVEDMGLNLKEEHEKWKRAVAKRNREERIGWALPWMCLFGGVGFFILLAFYGFR